MSVLVGSQPYQLSTLGLGCVTLYDFPESCFPQLLKRYQHSNLPLKVFEDLWNHFIVAIRHLNFMEWGRLFFLYCCIHVVSRPNTWQALKTYLSNGLKRLITTINLPMCQAIFYYWYYYSAFWFRV